MRRASALAAGRFSRFFFAGTAAQPSSAGASAGASTIGGGGSSRETASGSGERASKNRSRSDDDDDDEDSSSLSAGVAVSSEPASGRWMVEVPVGALSSCGPLVQVAWLDDPAVDDISEWVRGHRSACRV